MGQDLKGKRVLVTGAAGFIGSRLVRALLDKGAEVIGLVGKKTDLFRIDSVVSSDRLHVVRCDLTNTGKLSSNRKKWGKIDLLAHLGIVLPQKKDFCRCSVDDINTNLIPTMRLVGLLGSSLEGICFVSSTKVYGKPESLPISEKDNPGPSDSYAATKLAIENYLQAYGRTTGIPVTILRYSTVYGPGETGHRLIPNFLQAVSGGKAPRIDGDGSEMRDYIFVDDVVQATILALEKRPNRVLNIGSGRSLSTEYIAREIIRLTGADVKPEFAPVAKQNVDHRFDISAAREALSFYPETSLEDGLKQEISWLNNDSPKPVKLHRQKNNGNGSNGNGANGNGSHGNGSNGNGHTMAFSGNGHHTGLFSYSFWKDVTDRLAALVLVVLTLPVILAISIAIRLESPGSPIFAQERVGRYGRRFKAYKFRTMPKNNNDSSYKEYLIRYVLENAPYRVDETGRAVYKVDDAPLTRLGAFLRRTNLDELPQLFNVLKGEMSFVGPRPDIPYAVDMYKEWHLGRLGAKPGITGLWQICGRKNVSFEEMVRLDIDYINTRSFTLDTKIILSTVSTVLKRDGSS